MTEAVSELKRLNRKLYQLEKSRIKRGLTDEDLKKLRNMTLKLEVMRGAMKVILDKYGIKSKSDIDKLPPETQIELNDRFRKMLNKSFKKGGLPKDMSLALMISGIGMLANEPAATTAATLGGGYLIVRSIYNLVNYLRESYAKGKIRKVYEIKDRLEGYIDNELRSLRNYLGLIRRSSYKDIRLLVDEDFTDNLREFYELISAYKGQFTESKSGRKSKKIVEAVLLISFGISLALLILPNKIITTHAFYPNILNLVFLPISLVFFFLFFKLK